MLPKQNLQIITDALKAKDITNSAIIKGILACMAKECGLNPISEYSYAKTSNERLRALFTKRLAQYTDDQLSTLKTNNIDFYEAVYGGMYGNTQKGDAYKYRGRGFNGLTFKDAYETAKRETGIDFVGNPDLMNDPKNSAIVCANFFKRRLKEGTQQIKERFGVTDLTKLDNAVIATKIAVNANAGWGKDKRGSEAELRALTYLDEVTNIYDLLNKN